MSDGGGRRWVRGLLSLGGNRMARLGLAGVLAALSVALLAPLLTPFDPMAPDLERALAPPSGLHLFGTDQLGRDVLSRLLVGARVSLAISLSSVVLSVTFGTVLGSVAAFFGGWLDGLIMRFTDLVLAVPRLVLLIVVIALLRPSAAVIVLLLAAIQWPSAARLVRAEILSLREREFAEAARALGFSRRRVLLGHLLPNALAPVLVVATLGVGHTVILEAGLAFLGLGVPLSWGSLLLDGQGSLVTGGWWLAVFPGLAISAVAISFNLLGDGLRDVLDPHLGRDA